MQHTVIALFDTYPQAEAALAALLAAGLARDDIALKARCEPTYASDATPEAEARPPTEEGLLASIERFFESLFESREPPHEMTQYAEAVRRGAVMLSVDAATDADAEVARSTLERMNPIDIEARAATWHAPNEEAMREHSPLEELGLHRSKSAAPRQGAVRSYARDPLAATEVDEVGNRAQTGSATKGVPPPSSPDAAAARTVPDEYLQDEEFHSDDAAKDDEQKR